MMFSARSFSDTSKATRFTSSSSSVIPRGAVPFIGRVSTRAPLRSKNNSGEKESSVWSGAAMNAP